MSCMIVGSSPFYSRLFAFAFAFVAVLGARRVRAQDHDGWGVRVGVLEVDAYPGGHPTIEPYYETQTASNSPITIIGDLTLAYTDLAHLQIPSYDEDVILDYGFHGGVRYATSSDHALFISAQLGFDVYPDPVAPDPGHVSASFPLAIGRLFELSKTSQLEVTGIARPVWYFRQAWGFSYQVMLGIRFY